MGYLTTVMLRNDCAHNFREDPKQLGERILDGMDRANREHKSVDAAFVVGKGINCNPIEVQPSRHADDHQVYVHYGNTVFNINPWCEDFKELVGRNPDCAESFVKVAERMVKECKAKIKESKAAKKA